MSENLFNLILAISYSVIVSLFIFDSIRNRIKHKKLSNISLQLAADKLLLIQKLDQISNDSKLNNNKDFVNFLSTSRDWAYKYIEDTQKVLYDFDKTISKIIDYNKTYGSVNGESIANSQINEISVAYQKVKDFVLPSENIPNN